MVRAFDCTLLDFCDEVHAVLRCLTLCCGLYVRAQEEDDGSVTCVALIMGAAYLIDVGWRIARWRKSRIEQFLLHFVVGFSLGSIAFQKIIRRSDLDYDSDSTSDRKEEQQSADTLEDLTSRLFVCCTVFRSAVELIRRYFGSTPSSFGSPKRFLNITLRLDAGTKLGAEPGRKYDGTPQRFVTANWLAEMIGFGTSLLQFYGSSHMLIVCVSFVLFTGAVRVAPVFSLLVFGAFYAPVFVESYLKAYLHDVQIHLEALVYFVTVSLVCAALGNAPFPNARFGSPPNQQRQLPKHQSRQSSSSVCGTFELFLAAFARRKRITFAYMTFGFVPFIHVIFACVYIHQHRAPIVVVPLLIVCVLSWCYVCVVVNRIFYVTWTRLDDAIRWCSVMSLADSLIGRGDSRKLSQNELSQPESREDSISRELDVEIVTSLRASDSPTVLTSERALKGDRDELSGGSWQKKKLEPSGVRISLDSGGEAEQGGRDIRSLLSAKGVRYLGVIGLHLSIVLLVFYFAIALITYRTWNPLLVALMLASLPVQLFAISFFNELGSNLGGTSIAYAAILPSNTNALRSNELISAVRDVERERQCGRLTRLIGALQLYFQYGMLHSVGCDYASSSMELSEFTGKLRRFFAARTPDGLAYDNYLLVFVGPSLPNGDWQFAYNQSLTFDSLMKMWLEFNEASGSRLVLVVDSNNASRWLRQVYSKPRAFVALQTYQSTRSAALSLGEFTEAWLRAQMGRDDESFRYDDANEAFEVGAARMRLVDNDPQQTASSRIDFTFAVSESWYFYRLRLPTAYEVVAYYFSGHSLPPPGHGCIKFESKRAAVLEAFLCVTLRGHRFVQLAYSSCDCCRSKWYRLCPPPSLTLDNGLQLLGRSAAALQVNARAAKTP